MRSLPESKSFVSGKPRVNIGDYTYQKKEETTEEKDVRSEFFKNAASAIKRKGSFANNNSTGLALRVNINKPQFGVITQENIGQV